MKLAPLGGILLKWFVPENIQITLKPAHKISNTQLKYCQYESDLNIFTIKETQTWTFFLSHI